MTGIKSASTISCLLIGAACAAGSCQARTNSSAESRSYTFRPIESLGLVGEELV
jgi:hypothetical protein